ncbi:hypothetical protein [Actinomyces weissii]|uniref:SWIM-type domain-containing protein n=1 Tax=Actinomyces weissii TaxID=675090 RepID=A0A7T7S1R9_9ACTO|nr:hypothetical protein [Actinomyces weissii]QQM66930.1 hypothetical protein JG540_07685 [Actinomyces weissii]
MTRISPAVQAAIVDALSPRVHRRVDVYLAEPPQVGTVTVVGEATVTVAEVEVVTSPEQVRCNCLLAPRCAHRAVVALLLEPSEAEEGQAAGTAAGETAAGAGSLAGTAAGTTAGAAAGTGSPAGAAEQELRLTAAQHRVATEVLERLGGVLLTGTSRLGATSRAALARDLHLLRAHSLVTADRALTAFVQQLGGGARQRAQALATALLNLHQVVALGAGAPVGDLLGSARGSYREVGALRLVPLYAEPVLAASGFSGVQVVYTDASGGTWSVARLRPGDGSEVQSVYEAEKVWQELSVPLLRLSRHRLLLARATARDDGRLGAGAQVRASLGAAGTGWDQARAPYEVVEAEISGGNRRGLKVGGRFLALREAARARGAGLATELFGAARGTRVRCLSRAGELLGLSVVSGIITVPAALSGVWWPGLDVVNRSWVGALPPEKPLPESPKAEDLLAGDHGPQEPLTEAHGPQEPLTETGWTGDGPVEVRQVTARWCQRVLDAGPAVLASPALERDRQWLRAAGAPFAAELLGGLEAARHVGSRRFDGTWQADAAELRGAWLALSQY